MEGLTRPDCNEFSDAKKRKWSSVGQAGRQVRPLAAIMKQTEEPIST
jgi:hypothetical protein